MLVGFFELGFNTLEMSLIMKMCWWHLLTFNFTLGAWCIRSCFIALSLKMAETCCCSTLNARLLGCVTALTSSMTEQMCLTHWVMACGVPEIVTALSVESGSMSPATCTWAPVVFKSPEHRADKSWLMQEEKKKQNKTTKCCFQLRQVIPTNPILTCSEQLWPQSSNVWRGTNKYCPLRIKIQTSLILAGTARGFAPHFQEERKQLEVSGGFNGLLGCRKTTPRWKTRLSPTSRISLIFEPPLPIREPHWLPGNTSRSVTGGLLVTLLFVMAAVMSCGTKQKHVDAFLQLFRLFSGFIWRVL